MADWIFFMHPYRDRFMETMTQAEQDAFAQHMQWLQELDAEGRLILAGPCLGDTNTGVGVFEAVDEAEAKEIVAREPVTSSGLMRPDLRPFALGFARSRER
jgi:uncharacterized protein YciI